MEASEKKVSTRVQGAAWRRKDAPKARGVSFWERHGGVVEMREEEQMKRSKEMPAGIGAGGRERCVGKLWEV